MHQPPGAASFGLPRDGEGVHSTGPLSSHSRLETALHLIRYCVRNGSIWASPPSILKGIWESHNFLFCTSGEGKKEGKGELGEGTEKIPELLQGKPSKDHSDVQQAHS